MKARKVGAHFSKKEVEAMQFARKCLVRKARGGRTFDAVEKQQFNFIILHLNTALIKMEAFMEEQA